MNPRRPRIRAALIVLGIFTVLVASAAGLLRRAQPDEPPAATTATGSTDLPAGLEVSEGSGASGRPVQDEASAVSAALSYATAPQAWLYMTDDAITEAVAGITVPEATDRIGRDVIARVGAARSELAKSAGPIWWIVHPLAWKVDGFRPTEATVSVWTFSLLSAADVAVPQTEWSTTTLDLRWFAGEWRVTAVRDTVGPTPAIGPNDQPWEPEPLDDALEGFTRLAWGDSQ